MTIEAAFMPRPRVAASSASCVNNTFAIRRLRRNAVSLLNAHKDAAPLGNDDLVLSMVRSTGLDRDDLAAIRVAVTGKRYTLICVTNSTWHDPGKKAALLELKRHANRAGRNAVLIPATFIQREPRLGNCRAIETAAGMDVSAENRMAILIHLIENGYSTLFDCACVVDDASPFSVVLTAI